MLKAAIEGLTRALADSPGKWLIEARPVAAVSEATEAWFEVT